MTIFRTPSPTALPAFLQKRLNFSAANGVREPSFISSLTALSNSCFSVAERLSAKLISSFAACRVFSVHGCACPQL